MTLRPRFGVRTTWIRQSFKVKYEDNLGINQIFEVTPILPPLDPLTFDLESFQSPGDNFTVKKKSHWWGLGPDVGLDILFNVCRDWSLFGNFTAAIEYGFHKTSDKDKDETLDFTNIHFKDSFRTAHPILDIILGVNWMHEFCRYFLALQALGNNTFTSLKISFRFLSIVSRWEPTSQRITTSLIKGIRFLFN